MSAKKPESPPDYTVKIVKEIDYNYLMYINRVSFPFHVITSGLFSVLTFTALIECKYIWTAILLSIIYYGIATYIIIKTPSLIPPKVPDNLIVLHSERLAALAKRAEDARKQLRDSYNTPHMSDVSIFNNLEDK